MVMRRGATESASARDALGELAGRYWYPVYIYVRRCGHAPEAAGNIARRFLQQLLREVDDRSAQPSQGHYRSYLLSRLHTFLAAGPVDEGSPATEPAMPPGRSPSAPGRSASAAEATDGRERPPGRSPSAAKATDGRERPPVNTLQFKLVDASGENVWWLNRPDFTFPHEWQQIKVKKRQIEFAWGPTKDRTLRQSAAIEFVVSSGRDGGKGSIEVDELAIRELPPEKDTYPPPLAGGAPAGTGRAGGRSAARPTAGAVGRAIRPTI